MKVTVLSRKLAVQYCQKPHGEKSIMISISDPFMEYDSSPYVSAENNVVDILRLSFCDADRPGTDVYGRTVGEEYLLSSTVADEIPVFIERYKDIDNIIVHCDAGISRSAGVGAAILKYFNDDDRELFIGYFHPNMLCYRKTLEALYRYYEA